MFCKLYIVKQLREVANLSNFSMLSHACSTFMYTQVDKKMLLSQIRQPGASIPSETMMHFPPVTDSPLFSKNFRTLRKIFKLLPFTEKFIDFHPPKFLKIFFSHRISNFPLIFAVSVHFPLFRENYYSPPTLTTFPPVLHKFTCFLHTLRVFRFPTTFTMMHLCITQCTYWTPLVKNRRLQRFIVPLR